jgi:Tol biopolymer transport system component/DNA-binding winged helix-turn-helix (wHTH) protein
VPPRFLRFGAFELDVRAGELRKHGIRIRLQEQSCQILLMLLENPGEVVVRTDISRRLWPDEMVADADQSINATVRRLRTALSDSADVPAFIETLPKRGYRFIAPVEAVAEAVTADINVAVPAASDPAPLPAALPDRKRPSRLWWAVAVLLATGLAAGYRLIEWRGRDVRPPFRGPIPLTTSPGLSAYPAFSPDGESVAFCWIGPPPQNTSGRLHIFIKSVAGGEPVQITSDLTDDKLPQWSPDGSRIAVQRSTVAGNELVIVPVAGGAEQKVAAMGVGLTWSPDGKEIAYVAPYPPTGSGGIRVRTLATGRDRDLTDPRPLAEGLPAWSPDGKQIAFTRSLTQSARELFVVRSRGGPARRVTFDDQITEGLAWTADSRDLVFSSHRYGGPGLWRVSAAGGMPERIAAMGHHPAYPAVSVRGNRLAFAESFGDSNIWQYERQNTTADSIPVLFHSPRCLICSTAEDDSPRWSPDGRKIVFISRRTGSDELWLADSDGGYPIQLTSLGTSGNGSPRWSPDGHWIAFDSRNGGSPDIYVISAEGGAPRQLTMEPSVDIEPSWSRDGRWVYFTSNRGTGYHLWKVPFEGGPAQQVTQGAAAEAMESADGKRLYYFRNDRHDGIWTTPVAGGAEEVVPELADVKPTRSWSVRSDGILFFQHDAGLSPPVRFFSFATRRVTTVLKPERRPGTTAPGLDLSPDGRKLLYAQVDHRIEGLMMLENFH